MNSSKSKKFRPYWTQSYSIVVEFEKDFLSIDKIPNATFQAQSKENVTLIPEDPSHFGKEAGYYRDGKEIIFLLPYEQTLNFGETKFYVTGTFNNWGTAINKPAWEMSLTQLNGESFWVLKKHWLDCFRKNTKEAFFKFVTKNGHWLGIPSSAPNAFLDHHGNFNYRMTLYQTGKHIFSFKPSQPYSSKNPGLLSIENEQHPVNDDKLFFNLGSLKELGASIQNNITIFRLFAPRATKVTVVFFKNLQNPDMHHLDMVEDPDHIWEATHPANLNGWYYHYFIEGANTDASTNFNSRFPITDPYALALVSREGPGIILDKKELNNNTSPPFKTPPPEDLVIIEAHVKDLTAKAPIEMSNDEAKGFTGLIKFLNTDNNYLTDLGINAIELQPIQEFDAKTPEEYHWGYMPVNYFSPASVYSPEPTKGGQVKAFQNLVNTFHSRNIAVILDVVYNHVGEPNYLLFIDKRYYFEMDRDSKLTNWSGCGNDFRANTKMGKRLIIDSLIHFIQVYNVDGFRFDLAELIGKEVLLEIEAALKKIKPDVILIAEPWSFRGHIAFCLKNTSYISWNDGYRNFMTDYLLGHGNYEGFQYFIKGSTDHLAQTPNQSLNYFESHDDRCWLDKITENPHNRGDHPTLNDCIRVHLMIALLMCSLGIPMIAEGQDFLRSKMGVNNTYNQGDLNALQYDLISHYPLTHLYFKNWIQWRRSPQGKLITLPSKPTDQYLRFFPANNSSAIATLYNADNSLGNHNILFTINPHLKSVDIPLPLNLGDHKLIFDHECYNPEGLNTFKFKSNQLQKPLYNSLGPEEGKGSRSANAEPILIGEALSTGMTQQSFAQVELYSGLLHMPPLSCGLWITPAFS